MKIVTWIELMEMYPNIGQYAYELRQIWESDESNWKHQKTFPTHVFIARLRTWCPLPEWVHAHG